MVHSMVHEEFYTSGTVDDAVLGASAGWVCHAGSFADCQPIWNESHDIAVVFAGEHFSDPSESQALRAAGHEFSGADASSIVHLYEAHGPAFYERLNGAFCGAVLDRREKKVVVFNDRFGLGRVYFHEADDGFYFASEAKALLRVLPNLRKVGMEALGELMVCGCTLRNGTLFPGISLLPPASAWTFGADGSVAKRSYFNGADWEAQDRLQPEDYLHALGDCFNRVLPRYFSGNQKVALSITGGLDSRMIIAGLDVAPGTMPCYTFGSMYRENEDVRIGRLVASLCGQSHEVIRVDERFFPHFPTLAARCVYITDGTLDVSGSVGLYVNRMARGFGSVRMTGNYGSEILRENVAFKAARISRGPFAKSFTEHLNQAAITYRAERDGHLTRSFIAFKQVPWHHFARFAEENSQIIVRAPYLDNELVPLAYRAPAGLLLNKQLAYQYTTNQRPALLRAPTDRGMLARPKWIPKRMFELSKEVRPKFEYYFDYGMPHWLARLDRRLGALHMERLFLGQQKYYHFRFWYRHALAQNVREVLLDPVSLGRPHVDRRQVEAMVAAHTSGSGNYTSEIHKLMTCELVYRMLIDGSMSCPSWK
jgi:asparagine synthase (glutamine-hydrolysing)